MDKPCICQIPPGAGAGAGWAVAGVFLKGFPQFLQNWLMSGLFVPHGPQKHHHSPNDTILFMGT
jgi:hypothetical protein